MALIGYRGGVVQTKKEKEKKHGFRIVFLVLAGIILYCMERCQ